MFSFLNFLFPVSCISCGEYGSYLCAKCKKDLNPHPEICPITHHYSKGYFVRKDLLTVECPLDACLVLFRFDPCVVQLIRKLKYSHRIDIATFLSERLFLLLQSHSFFQESLLRKENIIISYVPSYRYSHYVVKGYNQSKVLAKYLAKNFKNSSFQTICKKLKYTVSQVRLSKEQRKNNLSDAFRVCAAIPSGSLIIVVDDVLTSGATLVEMSRIIKKTQPNCKVRGLCVARNG